MLCPHRGNRLESAISLSEHGTILYVPVVLLIVAVVIVAAVVLVATGRGGELSVEHLDYEPLDIGPISATDIILLRPPTALWGYSVQATDEALDQIAESIRQRDVRIVALEQMVADLSRKPDPASVPGGQYPDARQRHDQEAVEPGGKAASAPPEQSHG
jgi:hypothetical protein